MAAPKGPPPAVPKEPNGVAKVVGAVGGPSKIAVLPKGVKLPAGPPGSALPKNPLPIAAGGAPKANTSAAPNIALPPPPTGGSSSAAPKKSPRLGPLPATLPPATPSSTPPPTSLPAALLPAPLTQGLAAQAPSKTPPPVPIIPVNLPHALPPPLTSPTQFGAPALSTSTSSINSSLDDSNDEQSASARESKKSSGSASARRKGSGTTTTSKASDPLKPRKKKNSEASGSSESSGSVAVGSIWEAVYADFERGLLKTSANDFPANDSVITSSSRLTTDLPSKSVSKAPFYVQETMKFYTLPTKAVENKSEEYGRLFGFKDRAVEDSMGSTGQNDDANSSGEETTTASTTSSSAREPSSSGSLSARERSGSLAQQQQQQQHGRVSSLNSAAIAALGPEKKGKKETSPLLLARSSSVAVPVALSAVGGAGSSSGAGSISRAATAGRASSLAVPPVSSLFQAPDGMPISPKGTANMLSSWITSDPAARSLERNRRLQRPPGSPTSIFQALDAATLISDQDNFDLPAVGPIKSHVAPNQLLIRCRQLSWTHAPSVELLSCVISLHDVAQRIKLTEDFHFDFADDLEQSMLSTMLPELLGQVDVESKARRALLPLSYRSGSIYLLVRIKAVLKADTEESYEPYITPGKLKDQQRWMDSCAKSTKLLGRYRQPLAWGAVQVFNDASRLLLHDDTQIKLYRMKPALDDASFYDTITSPEKLKLAKQLEGTLSMSGFLYTPEKYQLQNILDPNLAKYSTFDTLPPALAAAPGAARTVVPDLVREVREFDQSFHQVYPNAKFENNFYLYPSQLVLSTSKIKAKQITLRAYLMSKDGTPESDGRICIYGGSNSANFLRSWTTTVDLGEKSPVFFDEIKFKLPVKLTDSHHIFFQALAINPKVVNPKKKTDIEAETLIGVSWMPIFKDNKFVADSQYTLTFQPIPEGASATPLPKGYFKQEPNPGDAIDEGKFSITFSTRLVSSLYTTNEHLASFYSNVIKSGDDYFRGLDSLSKVPEREILSRFAPILNHLFAQLCRDNQLGDSLKCSEKLKAEALTRTFLAIVDVASKVSALTMVHGKLNISEELLMYISCHFDVGGTTGSSEIRDVAFEVITSTWNKVLEIALASTGPTSAPSAALPRNGGAPGGDSEESRLATASFQELGWFFLSIITRALSLKVIEKGELSDESNRKSRYTERFSKALTKMVALTNEMRRVSVQGFDFFNRVLARFMIDLYRYMDRGFVSSLVSVHLAELAKEAKITPIFRFKFIQTLADYEHYVPLNQPATRGIESSQSGENIRQAFWRSHFIVGHYINEFKTLLVAGEEGRLTRTKSIAKLRDLLWKHSIDPRYASADWQTRIASMYFPLVVLAFENVDALIGSTTGLGVASAPSNTSPEWKDWCYVVLWILRNCNRDLVFRPWKQGARDSLLIKFLKFLRYCHETFAKPLVLANMTTNTANLTGTPATFVTNEIVVTIADVLDHFIEGSEERLSAPESKVFFELASLVVALLRSPVSSLATVAAVGLTRFLCSSLKKSLFRDASTNTVCGDIATELLTLCQQQHPQVMAAATGVLYLMIKSNYDEMKEFSRMRRHSTVALSNLIKSSGASSASSSNSAANSTQSNGTSTSKVDELNSSLDAMSGYKDSTAPADFVEQVQVLFQRHKRVLRDCTKVEQFTVDFADLKLDYCYKIASEYHDCPELRVQWLMEMAKLHEKIENWEEAGMCRLQVGSLVGQYLVLYPAGNNVYASIALPNSTYARVAPMLAAIEAPLGETTQISGGGFTEDNYLTLLTDACSNLHKADQFEAASDILTMYFQFCMDTRRYVNVTTNSPLLQDLSSKAEKAIRAQSRIPSNFYRVGFYGKEFKEDNGKEFIYKVPPSQRLADFTESMVKRYAPQLVVEVLNNKPISEQTIDPHRHYVQIVSLEPYFETDVHKDLTWLDRTRHLKRFYYETAYNPDGGRPSEDVSKMFKRKELITAKIPFPNFFKRVEVEKKETMVLQPIDCAFDLMVMLTSKLKNALNCVPVVSKNLQIILQGAVLAQVNAGPAAIIATFLGNADDYPQESVEKLKESVRAFIRVCNFGLILNQKLIQDQPDTAALQEAMMSSFQALQVEANKYIDM